MEQETEMTLSVKLVGSEIQTLEKGRELSGIRSNAEFIRFLIKSFVKA